MNPVEQMALLLQLMQAAMDMSGQEHLNKTQMHKLTYLAQISGLDTGFEFRMHHYGPYSFDLEGMTQALKGYGLVSCSLSDFETYQEYSFSLGEAAGLFIDGVGRANEQQQRVIELVASRFSCRSTRDLELLGTVHLMDCLLMQSSGSKPDQELVVSKTHALKPHFSEEEIGGAYQELVAMRLI